jgi:hypothetical protein
MAVGQGPNWGCSAKGNNKAVAYFVMRAYYTVMKTIPVPELKILVI